MFFYKPHMISGVAPFVTECSTINLKCCSTSFAVRSTHSESSDTTPRSCAI